MAEMRYDEEDLECLAAIEDEKHDGERRYYVYDAKDHRWLFLGRGHSPLGFVTSPPPPAYADAIAELCRAAKMLAVHRLRASMRQIERDLLDWAWA